MIPVGAILLIYFRMVRYVKRMSKRVTTTNNLFRAQRELKMIRGIIRLVSILLSFGIPFTIFMFMSFFNREPKYSFRIAYIFIDVSLALVMIALFLNTDQVKRFVMKKINQSPNTIVSIAT
jgi:hypothetical protein